jgi:hypothetical protein
MKFLASLAVLTTAVMANPVTRDTKQFHLKTSGATNALHNDLYVYAYHTGAGLNDAVLDKDDTNAAPFYLNGTSALATLGTEFPWGMSANGDTNYACKCIRSMVSCQVCETCWLMMRFILVAWEPIEINAGEGSSGFSIDNGNFVWSEADGFGGWLGE